MILLSGPPGSGKTRRVLAHFRASAEARRFDTLILVPTATLAQHLRHEMTREGLAFRPDHILTLSKFARQFTAGEQQVTSQLFEILVGAALRRLNRPEFARIAETKGLAAALARTMLEFDAAGVSARELTRALERGGMGEELPPAFAAIWMEVERDLATRGLVTRGAMLQAAAQKIRFTGIGAFERVCLDGFAALPAPELDLIEAIGAHAEILVTLPEAANSPSIVAARAHLLTKGAKEENLAAVEVSKTCARFVGESIEREIDEIARRILQYSAASVPFRRIGVVMRHRTAYQPLLETACERFGIPIRSYAGTPLLDHAPARFTVATVEALLSGWDHARTLEALRLGCPALPVLDDLEFRARERFPAHGLKELRSLAHGPLRLLDRFVEYDKLAGAKLTVQKWALQLARLRGLRNLGEIPNALDDRGRAAYLGQGLVFDTVDAALQEAATAFEPRQQLTLAEFWPTALEALESTTVRCTDNRREAVHLLSAQEARQWNLDVVFLCGLIEKQFPRKHPQNPLFRDSALLALRSRGVTVRTSEELTLEEDFLFAAALGAASREVVLSYPRLDARGQENTPSRFFSRMQAPLEKARLVCPAASMAPRVSPPLRQLQDSALLAAANATRASFSASGLETFLRCPLQFFFNRTLRLKSLPPLPEDRFDFLQQGIIVHAALASWATERLPLSQALEQAFERFRAEQHVPPSFALEAARLRIERLVAPFIEDYSWPPPLQVRAEEAFELALDPETMIRGKIDLIETASEGDRIYDFKYSANGRIRENLDSTSALQAPLYLRGYEAQSGRPVLGVFYIALKEGENHQLIGWGEPNADADRKCIKPLTPEWLDHKLMQVREAIADIRAGHIGARPVNAKTCEWCDFREACRYTATTAAAAGGDA